MIKRCVAIFSALVFLALIFKSIHLLTDGFNPRKILFANSYSGKLSYSSNEQEIEMEPIFNQSYTYLGHGRQSFVFQSEDHKYVIKFLRRDRLDVPIWARWPLFLGSFGNYQKRVAAQKKTKRIYWDKSLRIAASKLKDETALLFWHFQRTADIRKKLTVIDSLGRKTQVDLDSVIFLIQKKMDPLLDTLLEAKEKKEHHRSKTLLYSLLQTASLRSHKGISNRTRRCIYNTGVIGNKVFEFDFGELVEDNTLFTKEGYNEDMTRFTRHLRKWLLENYPEAVPFLDEGLKKLLEGKSL